MCLSFFISPFITARLGIYILIVFTQPLGDHELRGLFNSIQTPDVQKLSHVNQ